MTAAPPWSVKGIDPESREAAKAAARRAGLTLGAWLSQTIRGAAELDHGPVAADIRDESDGGAAPGALTELRDELETLALRLERHEARTQEVLAPLAARVEQLAASFAEARAGADLSVPELAGVVRPISERLEALSEEVRAVREHSETLEAGTTRAISPLVTRIEDISREIGELRANGASAQLADQLARLGARVDQLGRTTGAGESAANPALERSVVRLAERLDRIEQALEETRSKGMFGRRRP